MKWPTGFFEQRRIIARAYRWSPSEIDNFDLTEFKFWLNCATAVLKGKY